MSMNGAMETTNPSRLLNVRSRRTLWHMRVAALLALTLCAAPAVAGHRTSFHVGADVVSSARVSVTLSSGAIALASSAYGGRSPAVLLEQRSGTPVRLRDGSIVPREGQAPLVVAAGAEQRLALVPSRGAVELVVTLFPDGAPPRLRN